MRRVFSPRSRASVSTCSCSRSIRSAPPSACWRAANTFLIVQTRPPTRSRASTRVTAAPRCSRARAADSPASPAPATTTLVPARSRRDIIKDYTCQPMSWLLVSLLVLFHDADLAARIQKLIDASGAEVGVFVRQLDGPRMSMTLDPDKSFHASSTMKVPVMIELFRQAKAGKLSLDETHTI